MIVYLVVQEPPYEGLTIHYAYTSRERAQAKLTEQDITYGYVIELEVERDIDL